MSVLINIENYEVYYIDYLEGNLSGEQIRAFLTFMEEHPELKIDEEDFPVLVSDKAEALDPMLRNALKIDLSTAMLTGENVETFMIAAVENQLSDRQEKELNQFMDQHPNYLADFQLYKKSILPAEQLPYPFKTDLKKGGVLIPMYYKAIAIAASLILVFLAVKMYTVSPLELTKNQQASHKNNSLNKPQQKSTDDAHDPASTPATLQENNSSMLAQHKGSAPSVSKTDIGAASQLVIEMKKLAPFTSIKSETALAALSMESVPVEQNSEISQDLALNSYLSVQEMNAPIYLISKEIKERFNQDIDFRSAKATKNRQGGYYLKIGKFEITRKKKPVGDELASN